MSKKSVYALQLYTCAVLLIAGWWTYAFVNLKKETSSLGGIPYSKTEEASSSFILANYLSPLNRHTLREALNGDFSIMSKLISEWDVDAQILESHGVKGIKRLSRQEFLKSQLLMRQLKNHSKEELQSLSNLQRAYTVIDDKKQPFFLKTPYSKFLPQTYVSASILLALTNSESIVAIPKGLREQTHLFSPQKLQSIPLDIDRFNSEKLFSSKPEVAFVSSYSHPSTLNALQAQGVDLFHVDDIHTIPEILNALERIGHIVNKPVQAELLKIFLSAAITSIDNRFHAIGYSSDDSNNPCILLLNYHTHYSTPSKRTLVIQLLQRIGISPYSEQEDVWSIHLDQEQISQLNPDCLIFASSHPESLHRYLSQLTAFRELRAVKNRRLFYVDDVVQNFPSQYVVLAYFDLLTALSSAELK